MSKTFFKFYDEIIEYDACSCSDYCSLKESKIFYFAFDYIASSYIFYVDGHKQVSNNIYYFFRKKSLNNCNIIRRVKLLELKNI